MAIGLLAHKYDMPEYTLRLASWQEDSPALKLVREAVFIYEQGNPSNWNGMGSIPTPCMC